MILFACFVMDQINKLFQDEFYIYTELSFPCIRDSQTGLDVFGRTILYRIAKKNEAISLNSSSYSSYRDPRRAFVYSVNKRPETRDTQPLGLVLPAHYCKAFLSQPMAPWTSTAVYEGTAADVHGAMDYGQKGFTP